jgi:hypothetical protein
MKAAVTMAVALSQNPFYYRGRIGYGERGKHVDNLVFCGYGDNRDYSKPNLPPRDILTFIERCPKLQEYKMAPTDSESTLLALRELTANIRDERLNAHIVGGNSVLKACTQFSARPAWFKDGVPQFDDFLNAIAKLDRSKHPGFPACTFCPTKGDVLDGYLLELYEAVTARLIALQFCGDVCVTPRDYYETFCADCCCVSNKNEAIKFSKPGRIITSVSVVTAIVESMIYIPFEETFKRHVYEDYSMIGIGFSKRDSALLQEYVYGFDFVGSDVPFFDSSVTMVEGFLNVDVAFHSYYGNFPAPLPVLALAYSLEASFFNKLYILPDGRVFAQTKPGHQATGRGQTANFNTITRARRSYSVACVINEVFNEEYYPRPKCAGDDCAEPAHPRLADGYEYLSFPLRDVKVMKTLDFCSHDWPVDLNTRQFLTPVGQRIYKSLFKLIWKEPMNEEAFCAFAREYISHADFSACMDLTFELRPEVKTYLRRMLSNLSYVPHKKKGKAQAKPAKKAGKPKPSKTSKAKGLVPAAFNQPLRLGNRKLAIPQKIAHHKATCSVVDPFCIHARNAQRPDGTVSSSIPIQLRSLNSITAFLTNGAVNNVFVANPYFTQQGVASYSAPTWTMNAGATGSLYNTTALNVFKSLRVVSFGVIIRTTMTTATAKGTIIASTVQQIPFGGAITQGAMVSNEYEVMSLASGQTFTWVSKPIGPTAHEMLPKATWNSNVFQPQWTSLNIDVTGGDQTSGIEFMTAECVINIEGIVDDTGSYGIFQRPAPQPNSIAVAAANKVQATTASFTHGVVETATTKMASAASSALDSILSEGMAFFATLL